MIGRGPDVSQGAPMTDDWSIVSKSGVTVQGFAVVGLVTCPREQPSVAGRAPARRTIAGVTDAPPPPGRLRVLLRSPLPAPLLAACALALVEAVALVVQGLALLPFLEGERLTMGLTSTLFFGLYGVGLAWCAWSLAQGQTWARAPVVLAQLIQILLGAGFWGGETTVVAVVLVTAGVLVLAGVFHPRSLAALDHDR